MQEAADKVLSTVLHVEFGRSWPLAVASKWVDIATVGMRLLALALPKRILPRALEDARMTASLTADTAQQLKAHNS